MMDPFFLEEMRSELVLDMAPLVNGRAFVEYTRPAEGLQSESPVIVSDRRNMNKRMIEFLRAIPNMVNENRAPENDRNYRRMIDERLRREKHRQTYSALRSMLPPRTKNDKNSIVQMAAFQLQELEREKAKLQLRNCELEANLAVNEGEKPAVATIRLRVPNPSSAMESMVGVLQSLKSMNVKARMIRSAFSARELAAQLEIETQIATAEVEKAVKNTLMEVERRFLVDFPEE